MAMEHLDEAIAAAERFVKLAKLAKNANTEERKQIAERSREYESMQRGVLVVSAVHVHKPNPKAQVHRAAARRASMDLTRALADFRRS